MAVTPAPLPGGEADGEDIQGGTEDG